MKSIPARNIQSYIDAAEDEGNILYLVGERGGYSALEGARKAPNFPGMMLVETEHGFLYFDLEHLLTIKEG